MPLKRSTPAATTILSATSNEVRTALAFASNAALAQPEKTGEYAYLPATVEQAADFNVHPWVIAAIIAAMRSLRDGTSPVLGEPTVVFVPNPPVADHVALVSEGLDLGIISAARIAGQGGSTIPTPYADAAYKLLAGAVHDSYLPRPVRAADIPKE